MVSSKINGQSVFAISISFVCIVFEEDLYVVDPTEERCLHQGGPSIIADSIHVSPVLDQKRHHRRALPKCCNDKDSLTIGMSPSDKQLGFARTVQIFLHRFYIPDGTVADWCKNPLLFEFLYAMSWIDGDLLLRVLRILAYTINIIVTLAIATVRYTNIRISSLSLVDFIRHLTLMIHGEA
ncbi:hypothetical protein PENFLA_c001G05187 [Penicillium flavigenum]|uniref:Uncharacterized protein n=1 Tax=Penicillium flavigenum TaxID=254877 RepID=A0A1V6U2I9_9EURO|nr:hypothetical protein PENFLA_c001G05187 [Penicillium flavigenum]